MIEVTLICLAGFTLGLYAGKRRANGKDWGEIAKESVKNANSCVRGAWKWSAKQFRKDARNNVDAEATIVEPGE
jgi:hypothetical protein